MIISKLRNRKYMYKCNREEVKDLINDMNYIYTVFKNNKYDFKFIISLNLKELYIYKKLVSHYNALKLSCVNDRIKNEMGDEVISLLNKNKNIFEKFYKCIEISNFYYNKAYENNFIDYPYNLVSKELKERIIYLHNSLYLKNIFG